MGVLPYESPFFFLKESVKVTLEEQVVHLRSTYLLLAGYAVASQNLQSMSVNLIDCCNSASPGVAC